MSRSYRKTPICGMTTKESDKPFKKAEHKRARRAVKASDLSVEDPPAEKAFGNPWGAPKDGKQWVDPKVWPQILRK
ncbi:hypothetical protein Z946_623 [Sulfitobacter noctilucicola]|uniref:Uncharacterized protein n=1 Tax=Sulfitobacter noctilucicola TaxID=1342301 RepID=A0A7W6MB56_9RHOB|nr:hypothetical protein [Sulfitobacter noctilucicola]KIN66144.1 hypothetical protein Z946_623 [Sulfitobacter noctilucicola]MBB4175828.1 hypothetical protein [Sulfitobacter noctilucicola]